MTASHRVAGWGQERRDELGNLKCRRQQGTPAPMINNPRFSMPLACTAMRTLPARRTKNATAARGALQRSGVRRAQRQHNHAQLVAARTIRAVVAT